MFYDNIWEWDLQKNDYFHLLFLSERKLRIFRIKHFPSKKNDEIFHFINQMKV